MYKVVIHKKAKKKLLMLPSTSRIKVAGAIEMPSKNPEDDRIDIKKMQGHNEHYRLRVGTWRIIFEKDDKLKIISIEKIGARGGIYK